MENLVKPDDQVIDDDNKLKNKHKKGPNDYKIWMANNPSGLWYFSRD